MTLDEVMNELQRLATDSTKRTFLRHGAPEPLFGVKVGDLKTLQKKLKKQQSLALELYATGNSDAMYLAGMIADGAQMTQRQLDQWAKRASWHMIAGTTVPCVASQHPKAIPMALKWIDQRQELVATAGWATLGAVASSVADDQLPLEQLGSLLDRCIQTIHDSANRVRYAMNSYVICVGTYVGPLAERAMRAAKSIGTVEVDMGDTSCKVPEAASYIVKCRKGAPVAKKRKTLVC